MIPHPYKSIGNISLQTFPPKEKTWLEWAGGVYLVTPLMHAAEAGHYGDPVALPLEIFSADTLAAFWVDREKVERFKADPAVLAKPVLMYPDVNTDRWELLDGRHRLTAIRETGGTHISTWCVPRSEVLQFMLPAEVVTEAAEWWLATVLHQNRTNDPGSGGGTG